jgi:hypothetical protein
MLNGMIVSKYFEPANSGTDKAAGVKEGQAYAMKLAKQFPGHRIVFIGVAGMDYAAAVESGRRKKKDGSFYQATPMEVISGSSDIATKELTRLLKRIAA